MKLYLKYFSIHLRSAMQYKASFILTLLGQFLVSFSAFGAIYFLFSRFQSIDSFSFSEVLLCFAVVTTSFALAECFVRGFDMFQTTISNGEFDRIMVRPRNEIFQVLASKIDFSRLGRLVQSLIVFAYALPASGIDWSWDKILTLFLMLLGSFVIFAGLFLVYAAFCFFTTEGLEFMNIFTDGAREFASYPLSIYGNGILRFLTFVIPLACAQYYPLLYLLGKSQNLGYMLLPLISFLFLIPCFVFWRFGVRHYKSTGS